jgi:hypothetical protein
MITLENVIHRFRLFAQNHNFIQSFSHGQEADLDLEKFQNYPIMHVVYRGLDIPNPKTGAEVVYRFSVVFLDKPTIQEDKTEQALFALGDTQLYALDLLAELRNGHEIFVFDEDFEIESAAIQYLQEEYSNTLWGTILDLGLSVPYEFNACINPIEPYVPPTPSFETIRVRNTDGVLFLTITSSVDQTLQDVEVEGADIVGSFPQPTRIVVEGADVESVDVNDVTGEMTITVDGEVCSPAIYSNGGAFSQEIASGGTYTAPEIVVTDVNGVTRNVLPNIGVTCAWSAITVRSTDSEVIIGTISAYPSGGVALMGNQRVKQQDDTIINTVPWRGNIKVINADVASVFTAADETQIVIVKETCPTLAELIEDATWSEIEDDLSPAQLEAAEASICTPAPTAIAPMFIPATQKTVYFTGKLDEGGRIAAGDFDMPAGPFAEQQGSDYSATTPFLTLLHNNEFGNKSAFCDTAGNPLDYSSATPADNIVLHTGYRRMWYVVRTAATSVDNALDLAAAASHGGFTDWRIPTRSEIHTLFDYDNTNAMNTVSGKPPGFFALSTAGITSCTTNSLSTSSVFATFSNGARQTTPVVAFLSKNFILVRTY